eukprot:2156142-Rhodomonas_salina.1
MLIGSRGSRGPPRGARGKEREQQKQGGKTREEKQVQNKETNEQEREREREKRGEGYHVDGDGVHGPEVTLKGHATGHSPGYRHVEPVVVLPCERGRQGVSNVRSRRKKGDNNVR